MRRKVILACSICNQRNYTNEKQNETATKRMELKKFCKTCNAHTLHKETK